jgi:hypothetical protein
METKSRKGQNMMRTREKAREIYTKTPKIKREKVKSSGCVVQKRKEHEFKP